MLNTSLKRINDDLQDEISILLKALRDRKVWNNEAKLIVKHLSILTKEKYLFFDGSYKSYELSKVGKFCFFDVAETRKGHLSVFRGKRVRLVYLGPDGSKSIGTKRYSAKSL